MIKYICDRCKQEFETNEVGISPIMDVEFILKGHNFINGTEYGGGIENHCYPRLQLCTKCFEDFQKELQQFVKEYQC